jgi:hypothetical protein
MDYKYINEHLDDVPRDEIDFLHKLEKGCNAFDISIYDKDEKLKSVGELIKDISIASLKYYNSTLSY